MEKDLKEGAILYRRRWNIWNDEYLWEFEKVKKITPTGKIRLESGILLPSMEDYNIYDSEAEKAYTQDNIKRVVKYMISNMERNIKNILNEISNEDIIRLGNFLEELKIENVNKWGNETTKRCYQSEVEEFKKLKNKLETQI